MKEIILIKLGGSLITDKSRPMTPRPDIIRRLGTEIKSALSKKKNIRIILSHGSGSFGHIPAKKYGTAEGFQDKLGRLGACITNDIAARLNRIVIQELISTGLAVGFIPPSSIFVAENGKTTKVFVDPILILLDKGIIPVIYGDVIWDTKKGSSIFSGETCLKIISRELIKRNWKISRNIQLGIEKGVLDRNGEIIPLITLMKFRKLHKKINGSANPDVTGGMWHKVKESLEMGKFGIETLIASGEVKGLANKALTGKKVSGTIISV
ncbi:amino acid kinase [Candidatus Collierbacteria bacterium]|nr:amino acid kinase [Candidatus Collierbacteria bacterium]